MKSQRLYCLVSRVVSVLVGMGSIVTASGPAYASSYTGIVLVVRTSASPNTPGNTRISVQTNSATACSLAGWYSYDMPAGSVGNTWTAILLAAQAGGRTVTIMGTGACDAYGLETVSYIDSNSQ